jgi:hypothetical protein
MLGDLAQSLFLVGHRAAAWALLSSRQALPLLLHHQGFAPLATPPKDGCGRIHPGSLDIKRGRCLLLGDVSGYVPSVSASLTGSAVLSDGLLFPPGPKGRCRGPIAFGHSAPPFSGSCPNPHHLASISIGPTGIGVQSPIWPVGGA